MTQVLSPDLIVTVASFSVGCNANHQISLSKSLSSLLGQAYLYQGHDYWWDFYLDIETSVSSSTNAYAVADVDVAFSGNSATSLMVAFTA